jgi:AmmeMemoRadiSam system protein B/AmmeMemoRadiSam system protein A
MKNIEPSVTRANRNLKQPFISTFHPILYNKNRENVNLLFARALDILKRDAPGREDSMKRTLLTAAIIFAFAVLPAAAQGIKPPVVAGQFYERDPVRLAAQLDAFLANAGTPAEAPGKVLAIIVPHAGYIYCGQTAAYAYALVKGGPYDTAVIIGPSHFVGFDGCSIYPEGGFETPLGVAPVDAVLAKEIARNSGFSYIPEAFAKEHSVEVEVPWVQTVLPKAKIVPIVMGYQTRATVLTLADALEKACAGKRVLVIASTDLSHYLPPKEGAKLDADTISLIQGFKTETLLRKIEAGENIMCGGGPVVAALLYARKEGPARVDVLKHSNTADAGGPADSVVGYMAAAVVSGKETPDPSSGEVPLTAKERADLLSLARSAVTEFLAGQKVISPPAGNPRFLSPRGVFVTLEKHGELRGCIGFIEPIAPLGQAVIQAAIYAATEDPRFPRVTPEEVKDLRFEISVLGPLREISNPALVQVGRDGIVVSMAGQKGVLLPQVPVENGWDRETFLNEGCIKAGLPPDAWKKGAHISVFEAVVFHE